MIQMMKAAVVHAFHKPLVIEELPVPQPGPSQVLVRVACHTELHAADGDWLVELALPFVPGHEGVGYVALRVA